MLYFIKELKNRNEPLFVFAMLCLGFALLCLLLTQTSNVKVYKVNAWYKPFKFAFPTFFLVQQWLGTVII